MNNINNTINLNITSLFNSTDFNSTIFNDQHNVTLNLVDGSAPPQNETEAEKDDTNGANRYRNSNELKYSIRSLIKNAPWVHHIYIVTDNQIPNWLNLETDKLSIVTHEQIFSNLSHLPVFSSPAIETHLHRIPGLSKRFIYFNDDVFLGSPVSPEDFVSLQGVQKLTMSWDVPKCAPGCSDSWIGDGYCDKACNVASCNFDFPDCVNGTGTNNAGYNGGNKGDTKPIVHCMKGCPDNWLADKICDQRCNSDLCGYDVGDCGIDLVLEQFPGAMLTLENTAVRMNERSFAVYEDKMLELYIERRSVRGMRKGVDYDQGVGNNTVEHHPDANSSAVEHTQQQNQQYHYEQYMFYNYTQMALEIDRDAQALVIAQNSHQYNDSNVLSYADLVLSNNTFYNTTSGRYDNNTHNMWENNGTDFNHTSTLYTTDDEQMRFGQYHSYSNRPVDSEDYQNTYGGGHFGDDNNFMGLDPSGPINPTPSTTDSLPLLLSVPLGTKVIYIDISLLPAVFVRNETARTVSGGSGEWGNPMHEKFEREMMNFDARLAAIVGVVKWGDVNFVEPEVVVVEKMHANIVHRHRHRRRLDRMEDNEDPLTPHDTLRRRRLQDTYAQSLIHVNRLYNKNYGVEARKVPAHLPHMIDTDVMNEMQSKFSQEWQETSQHRFRSVKDMQYSFSYYYYVIHRHKASPPDLLAFLRSSVDTNYDHLIDHNEMHTLVAILKGHGPTPDDLQSVYDCIARNGTGLLHANGSAIETSVTA
eukprot:gene24664-31033_t